MIGDLIILFGFISIVVAVLALLSLIEFAEDKAKEKQKKSRLAFERARYESSARANKQITFVNCYIDGLRGEQNV